MAFLLTLGGYTLLVGFICWLLPRLHPESFRAQRELYAKEHRSLGCRLTHMFGIPMIFLSLPFMAVGWIWAIAHLFVGIGLFVIGWALQLAGHSLFEGNKPVLASSSGRFFTLACALIFVVQEWKRLFTGRSLRDGA